MWQCVSGKSIEEIQVLMVSELEDYTLNLKERGGKTEQIKATDVGLMYKLDEQLQTFNRYLTSKITYTFGKDKEILDSSIISYNG